MFRIMKLEYYLWVRVGTGAKSAYLDPRLSQWLEESYGGIVYQEPGVADPYNLAASPGAKS